MLENSRLSVVFVTRKHNARKETIKLYARVTIDGKRAEFSLNWEFEQSYWDERRKRGKGTSKYVISVNKYLDEVFTGLHEAHRELLKEEAPIPILRISCHMVKDVVLNLPMVRPL